jgi:tetratricopeptide (TPR) repeat protein
MVILRAQGDGCVNGSYRPGLWLPLTVCAALGCGCAANGPAVAPAALLPAFRASGEVALAAAPVPPVESFLRVEPAMRAWVGSEVGRVLDRRARLRRLAALLLDPSDRGIVYDADLTLSAAGVFERRRGNCLSFAALLVVLAREAGLDAWFQDVPVLPNWRLDGDAFVVERHVNVVVRAGGEEYVLDFRPPGPVATTRTRRIPDSNATAQYFGNLGVERFSAGDLAGAYALLRRGLEADPGAASLWVNLGVVLGRNGQAEAAVAAYEQALALERGNLSALSNLAGLEAARGNEQRAAALRDRVAAYRAGNPYYQYWLGEGRLRAGDARGALQAYGEAARLMPEEADFRFALARASLALGRPGDAGRHLDEALARAPTDAARIRYRQRFETLPATVPVEVREPGQGREER